MTVYEFNGKFECKNLCELNNVLSHRSSLNSNDFELRPDGEYPYLTILIKDKYACVHFYSDENDCGHVAFADKNNTPEYVEFNLGSENNKTKISKDIVISLDQAYEIANCFFKEHKMSNKIQWLDL